MNVDDVFFGGGGFAKSRLKKERKSNDQIHALVIDDESKIKDELCLKKKSSSVILLDEQGEILYFHDGKMPEEDIVRVVDMILEYNGKTREDLQEARITRDDELL